MDKDFSDITIKDTVDRKSIFKTIMNIISSLFILFAIISIFITLININNISNNKKGYLIHDTKIKNEKDYSITTYHYLCYKIVKVDKSSSSNTYFRLWFMEDIDY